jgi:pimeloyl-ACP methyl ester carboxylesterase
MLAHSDSDSGSGKTILFLHGLGLNKEFWSSTIAHLSPAHRCIAVDLPGHGASKQVACDGSMSSYAKAVRALIEQLNLRDITLVGHSMGGQIAIILALQMPAVISKLVLVSSAGIETFTSSEAAQLKSATAALYRNPISDDLLQRTYAHVNPQVRTRLMHEHITQQRDNFQQFAAVISNSIAGMLNEPVFTFLDKLTQPTLCIYGQLDFAIPNRYLHAQQNIQQIAQAAKSKIPECEAVIFPAAGHYLPVDAPDELAAKIQRFI